MPNKKLCLTENLLRELSIVMNYLKNPMYPHRETPDFH